MEIPRLATGSQEAGYLLFFRLLATMQMRATTPISAVAPPRRSMSGSTSGAISWTIPAIIRRALGWYRPRGVPRPHA